MLCLAIIDLHMHKLTLHNIIPLLEFVMIVGAEFVPSSVCDFVNKMIVLSILIMSCLYRVLALKSVALSDTDLIHVGYV